MRTSSAWARVGRGTTTLLACLSLWGCQADTRLAPDSRIPPPPASVAPYAFYLEIDMTSGSVRVVPPAASGPAADGNVAYSLAGAELIGFTTSNFFRSSIGQFVANKRTITFDIALTNKLSVTDLVTPTFPLPPNGTQGILVFPYTVAAYGVQGGQAIPNADWNGTGAAGSGKPLNFFNDFGGCGTAVTSDCYRWELFPAPLLPGQTTAAQKVGFTVDKNVTNVGVYLVVAADLLDHPPAPPQPGLGALLGSVSSPQLGALTGVTVTLASGGQTAVTDGLGNYLFSGLPVGPFTATVSGLPASCSIPAGVGGTITSGGVATADFAVSCAPPTGSLTGQIQRFDTSPTGTVTVPLAGVTISLGGRVATSDPNGTYTLTGLVPGTYQLDHSSLPGIGNCLAFPGPVSVTVIAGQTASATIGLICLATLQGQITNAQGPMPQVTVEYQNLAGARSLATSDAAGHYQATIPSGVYSDVAVQPPAGCSQLSPSTPQQLSFAPGQDITLDFVLDCTPTTGTVQVSAAAQAGGVRNFTVTAMPGGYSAVGGGPAGLLADLTLPAGHYTLSLSNLPNGCPTLPQPLDVDVGGGTTQSTNFSLSSCLEGVQGTIRGLSAGNPNPFPLFGVPLQVGGQSHSTDAAGFYSVLGLIGPEQIAIPQQLNVCLVASPSLVNFYVLPGEITVLDFFYDCP